MNSSRGHGRKVIANVVAVCAALAANVSIAVDSAWPLDALVHMGDVADEIKIVDPGFRQALAPKQDLHEEGISLADRMRIAEVQILFDRAGISSGAVSGKSDVQFARALSLYSTISGNDLNPDKPDEVADALVASGGPAFDTYTIMERDVAGPFTLEIPGRIQDQSKLRHLSYQRVSEALAERFHMDEAFLQAINPEADFNMPGTEILVAQIGRDLDVRVDRVVASRAEKSVRAYDAGGRLVALYPASIGSMDNPSPQGNFTVRNKAANPFYTLAHDNTFELVSSKRNFRIAPGPNNPVGIAWIGLSKPTYGIHGTPEPSRIGQAESHGCIRLTNWDAMELARLVRTGVEVIIE